jgi:hypothetical protein
MYKRLQSQPNNKLFEGVYRIYRNKLTTLIRTGDAGKMWRMMK